MLVFFMPILQAQVTLQPEWISPLGPINAMSDDKTKFLTVGRGGFTYTDINKDATYTLLLDSPHLYYQNATMSNDGKYIVLVKGVSDSLKKRIILKVLDAGSGKELRTKTIDQWPSGWGIKILIIKNNLLIFGNGALLVTDFLDDSDSKIIYNVWSGYHNLKISPKSSYLAITEVDTVKIWETKTWSLLGTVNKESTRFSFVNFSPDESKLITIDEYPSYAKIWDIKTMSLLMTLKDDVFSFNHAAFSENADRLVTQGLNGISIWDLKNGKMIRRYEQDMVVSDVTVVLFNKSGDKILTSRDGMIRISNVADGKKIAEIENHHLLRFVNDGGLFGDTLITAEKDQPQTNVWVSGDKGFTMIYSIVGYDNVSYASFTNDDKYIRLFGSSLQTWDIHTKRKAEVGTNPEIGGRLYKVIGSLAIYETTFEHQVYVDIWDIEKNEKVLQIPSCLSYCNFNLLLSKDQSKIFFDRKDYDSNVRIMSAYDVKKKEYLFTKIDSVSTFEKKYFTSISPDGKKVLVIERDSLNKSLVKMLNVLTGKESEEFFVDTNYNSAAWLSPVCTAMFSPNGRQILITDSKRFVYVLDAETYTLLHTFDNGERKIGWRESVKAVYSNSADIMAVYGLEHTMDIWNVKTAQKIATLHHPRNVKNIQFNKQENEVITSCTDKNIYVWDIYSGKVKYVLTGSKDTLININYSNNEKKVTAVCSDGPALLWDVSGTTSVIENEESVKPNTACILYPNPTEHSLSIDLKAAAQNTLNYYLSSSFGEVVQQGIIPAHTHTYTIDIHTLPAGMYIFSMNMAETQYVAKIIINN